MNSATKIDYPVYDCDHHYYEPAEAFLKHLPDEYKKYFQYVEINGRIKLAVDGVITDYIPNPTFSVVAAPGAHEDWYRGNNPKGLTQREMGGKPIKSLPAFHDGEAHLQLMDEKGIHAAIVLPTLASVIEERLGHRPKVIQALFHSLNMWVNETYGFKNGRQYPVGAINLSDVDAACKELQFLLDAGCRCVLIRPAPVTNIVGTASCSHGLPQFDPFWKMIEDSGIFVIHHVSDSGYDKIRRDWTDGAADEWRAFEKDSFGEVLDTMGRAISDSLAALVCHGVFDRFPNIRIASLENGSAWLQGLLDRLSLVYKKMPETFSQDPIKSFQEHVFIAPFFEDDIEGLIGLMGSNRVLFGSDWPHPEGLENPLSFLEDIEDLSDEDRKLVMHSNMKGLVEGERNLSNA